MPEAPRTRYATSGDVRVAFQEMGQGPPDLLLIPDGTMSMEATLEEPAYARFLRRLASFSRLTRFDRRGTGLSDPLSASNPPTLDQWCEDALAVLDAVGCERVALVGLAEGSFVAAVLAATKPERVTRLILVNATP